MGYVKIPIKSIEEGKEIAEEIFGSMIWNHEESGVDNKIMAYPYNSDNPIIITTDE